ncbi:hypothetical protein GCM10020221_27310 [Streptomyces thioluteus]|uniref:Uncharacterized protein n=1 Tax=Streptomyces thioluteus TaxID=66431 RepID=A0ABN3WYH6_STRTU
MSAGEPPDPSVPHGTRFWPRVWLYWATGGVALVLGAVLPVLLQDGSSGNKSDPPVPPPTSSSPPGPGPSTSGPPSPTPPPPTTPSPASPTPSTLRIAASVVSVLSQGAVSPGVTRIQVNVTFTGLKGRTAYIKWHTYNDATKQTIGLDYTVRSPALGWDVTNWHPTFSVVNPTVHWQLQVTAFGPDGAQLATNHSNFTFSS